MTAANLTICSNIEKFLTEIGIGWVQDMAWWTTIFSAASAAQLSQAKAK
jgi:hypothetical protein